MKRRILSLVLACAAALGLCTAALAEEDVPPVTPVAGETDDELSSPFANCSEWARGELSEAQALGLVPYVINGADMRQPITRAEFAALAVRLCESLGVPESRYAAAASYTDTGDESVLRASALGIAQGYGDGSFRPSAGITRQEAAAMLTRAYKAVYWEGWTLENDQNYTARSLDYGDVELYADNSAIESYAYPAVYFLTKQGAIGGVGENRFAPTEGCTREQAVAMSVRLYKSLMSSVSE